MDVIKRKIFLLAVALSLCCLLGAVFAQTPLPEGVRAMLAELNGLQGRHPALSEWDCDPRGFEWLSGEDQDQSVISFLRRSANEALAIVLNFTPVVREHYRIPVPEAGGYRELFNSDDERFGGSDVLNRGVLQAEPAPFHGREFSLCITLPPLSGVILCRQS